MANEVEKSHTSNAHLPLEHEGDLLMPFGLGGWVFHLRGAMECSSSGGSGNYAQPFFVMWDKVFGTYVPYSIEKRKDGGFEARPGKKD
ncbi:Sphinganine C(4)-monooxygenase 1 [Acorus calamus]|uniref:Sphinganine C(4)-monooxygenase 1 n=1 Tax=Acorus calamus TaxID=4465 RepID=A0AAV9E7N1_ACOCL|nr:Sphinganine C(4)-monooxygenase 1 [Acorus calamus]